MRTPIRMQQACGDCLLEYAHCTRRRYTTVKVLIHRRRDRHHRRHLHVQVVELAQARVVALAAAVVEPAVVSAQVLAVDPEQASEPGLEPGSARVQGVAAVVLPPDNLQSFVPNLW